MVILIGATSPKRFLRPRISIVNATENYSASDSCDFLSARSRSRELGERIASIGIKDVRPCRKTDFAASKAVDQAERGCSFVSIARPARARKAAARAGLKCYEQQPRASLSARGLGHDRVLVDHVQSTAVSLPQMWRSTTKPTNMTDITSTCFIGVSVSVARRCACTVRTRRRARIYGRGAIDAAAAAMA